MERLARPALIVPDLIHLAVISELLPFVCVQVFNKEVEARSVLKASVISTGTQLLQLKDTDTAALQTQLTQLEQCWAEVLSALPAVQERLHQASAAAVHTVCSLLILSAY